MNILSFPSLPSTHRYAEAHSEDLSFPTLILAELQTDGCGRGDHTFFSPVGGLYATLCFETSCPAGLITPAAAVAGTEQLRNLGFPVTVKWVNDLLLNGKKVAGILTKRLTERRFLCSIGINLQKQTFPDGLNAVGLYETPMPHLAETLALRWAEQFLRELDAPAFYDRYCSYLGGIGKEYRRADGAHGILLGVDDRFSLRLRDETGAETTYDSGEWNEIPSAFQEDKP